MTVIRFPPRLDLSSASSPAIATDALATSSAALPNKLRPLISSRGSMTQLVKAPTLEEIRNPHLIRCRLAYGMMHKTKSDLVELFSDAESRTIVLRWIEVDGDLEESRKFFEGAAKLIEAARLRLIIAGSSFTEAAP